MHIGMHIGMHFSRHIGRYFGMHFGGVRGLFPSERSIHCAGLLYLPFLQAKKS